MGVSIWEGGKAERFVSALEDLVEKVTEQQGIIDDTAGSGNTDKVWSADKVYTQLALKATVANPVLTGSVNMGRKANTTTGTTSTVLGDLGTASASSSVAINHSTTASGNYSFAQGNNTTASSASAVSINERTTASGKDSLAQGCYTVANHLAQSVFGQYNVADPSTAVATAQGNYAVIVGNGTADDARSDAMTLDWNGNLRVKGSIYAGASADGTGGTAVLTSHQDISGKADKVSSATNDNFAALDSNGNLRDSGHKHSDYLTAHQDISGKADKVGSATNDNFAALDSNGNLKDSGHKHSDYLTSHQDISGKADKVSGATSGHLASLDSNGNLTDSGKSTSDFVIAQNGNPSTPEVLALKINNTGTTADVLTWGGGLPVSSTNVGGILYVHSSRKYIFRSKGSTNGFNEDYVLPAHSDGSADVEYSILTTKDYPFTRKKGSSPGGTTSGDGTNKITFTSPGDSRHALVCFAKESITLYCASASDSTVYSTTLPSGWTLTKSSGTYTLTRTATTVFGYTILWL